MQNSAENGKQYDTISSLKESVLLDIRKHIMIAFEDFLAGDDEGAKVNLNFAKFSLPPDIAIKFRQNPKQIIDKRCTAELPSMEEALKNPDCKRVIITQNDVDMYPDLTEKKLRAVLLINKKKSEIVLSEMEKFYEKVVELLDAKNLYLPTEQNNRFPVIPTANRVPQGQMPKLDPLPESLPH